MRYYSGLELFVDSHHQQRTWFPWKLRGLNECYSTAWLIAPGRDFYQRASVLLPKVERVQVCAYSQAYSQKCVWRELLSHQGNMTPAVL